MKHDVTEMDNLMAETGSIIHQSESATKATGI